MIPGFSLVALALSASAVEVRVNTIPDRSIFGVELAGSRSQFYAKADRIIGVSWQEYTTGTFIVSEVVIDLDGSSQQLRLYATRTPSSNDLRDVAERGGLPRGASVPTPGVVRDAENRAGASIASAATTLPVKVYPTTTHARTIEYVVSSPEELRRFYDTFRDLWIRRPIEVGTVATNSAFGSSGTSGTNTNSNATQNANNSASQSKNTVSHVGGVLFLINP